MREYELEVLEQYDIEVESTRKIRGAFFCDTSEGTMLLKETKLSDRKASLLYKMLCRLEAEGCQGVDTPVFTRENTLVSVSRDGNRYMLKRWFSGRECDVRREADVLAGAKNLALLHQKLYWEEKDEEESLPVGRHLKEEFLCHNRELKKVRSYIRSKGSKGKFEYLFLEHFEKIYHLALQVTQRLEESGYEKLYRDSVSRGCLIHGDYNYHNILMSTAGSPAGASAVAATTNFDHFRTDVQAQDLYYFLRKVMEKHRWQESLGRAVLEIYTKTRELKAPELEFIALKLAYPEKFWKTANTYYHSGKVWIPEKNVEKLKLSIIQTEEKLEFLRKIFAFNL